MPPSGREAGVLKGDKPSNLSESARRAQKNEFLLKVATFEIRAKALKILATWPPWGGRPKSVFERK